MCRAEVSFRGTQNRCVDPLGVLQERASLQAFESTYRTHTVLQTARDALEVLKYQCSCKQPQVLLPAPVLVLRTTNLGREQTGRGFYMLIALQPGFNKAPNPIHDVGTGFEFDPAPIGQLVGNDLHKSRGLAHTNFPLRLT